MGSFAAYLRRSGIRVTGSDQNVYPPMSTVLQDAGVELFEGYRAENLSNLPARPDLVVIGNVVRPDNPEARYAIDHGFAYASLPEFMEKHWLAKTRNLVVAGTHGKTTTSTLLAFALRELGGDPSWFIGGVPVDLPYAFHVAGPADGSPFVLEGDEYDTAFWDKVPKFNHYLPDDVILTSVEYDHADIYPNMDALLRAFQGLLDRIRPSGNLIACVDYPSVRDLLSSAKVPVLTYGTDGSAKPTLLATRIRAEGGKTVFDIEQAGKAEGTVSLLVPGKHNVLNALSVYALLTRVSGKPRDKVIAALGKFQGVKRRQEERGEPGGILVIDDFAHHPTAVRETLNALSLRYAGRRIHAVFEPRSNTSRRRIFQKEYAGAFGPAAEVYLARPKDTSRIAAGDVFSSEELADDLKVSGSSVTVFSEPEEGIEALVKKARPGDLVAVLSNGGFGGFIPKLLEKLRR